MVRLITLGGLTLQAEGQVVTGAATQRRRLALLALLAAAGERGITRDKLMGLLWPDSEVDRARHVLAQLLHAQRRSLDEEQLFLGGKTLRLNPACFSVDLWEFRAAVGRGGMEEAAALYCGPFLDGFVLSGPSTFDHWLEREREELSRTALQVLEALASKAVDGGDHHRAVRWLRRAVQLDPYNGRVVTRLIDELVCVGDRAAAIQCGAGHAERLRKDLRLEVDPDIANRLNELRASPTPRSG